MNGCVVLINYAGLTKFIFLGDGNSTAKVKIVFHGFQFYITTL